MTGPTGLHTCVHVGFGGSLLVALAASGTRSRPTLLHPASTRPCDPGADLTEVARTAGPSAGDPEPRCPSSAVVSPTASRAAMVSSARRAQTKRRAWALGSGRPESYQNEATSVSCRSRSALDLENPPQGPQVPLDRRELGVDVATLQPRHRRLQGSHASGHFGLVYVSFHS